MERERSASCLMGVSLHVSSMIHDTRSKGCFATVEVGFLITFAYSDKSTYQDATVVKASSVVEKGACKSNICKWAWLVV